MALANGHTGLAILFDYLDLKFPNERWDLAAKHQIELAIASLHGYGEVEIGLFSGVTGLAFSVWCLSREGTRYTAIQSSIDSLLLEAANDECTRVSKIKDGYFPSDFDLIRGLTGIATYLICRIDEARLKALLLRILTLLVDLTVEDNGRARWHIGPGKDTGSLSQTIPGGYLDCGLAHGIAGPLALMSMAELRGLNVTDLRAAIERTATWLVSHQVDDGWGVNWPAAVPLDPTHSLSSRPARTAWCYGAPGIASALWLAGLALEEQRWRDHAVYAIDSAIRRPRHERHIDRPAFCHGAAGFLHILTHFANRVPATQFRSEVDRITTHLLEAYDNRAPFGFVTTDTKGLTQDDPGLLEGSAGVVLTLLATISSESPHWSRAFLIS